MNSKLRTFSIVLSLGFALSSCDQESNEGSKLHGQIANADGVQLTLLRHSQALPDTISSAKLGADGNFEFYVNTGRLSFYTLEFEGAQEEIPPIFLALDSTHTDVDLSADLDNIKNDYRVSGSEDSEDIRNYFVEGSRYERILDSTMNALQTAAAGGDQALRVQLGNTYNNTRKEYRDYLIAHIDEKPSSIANYSILQRLDIMQDIERYKKVRDALEPRMAGNYFFDVLAEKTAQAERQLAAQNLLAPGSEAPEIVLPNPSGEMIALSSLRGKYVLIDFWASWCKPCRLENPRIVQMYNKYKDKGFEIYGVSLDRDKDKWIKAIEEDKLEWPQVSDLQFWNSAAAKMYNVQSIPFTLLIDPEGKIVATKLRGRALQNKMDEIFGG